MYFERVSKVTQKCPPIRENINNTKCDFQGVKLKTITGISAPYLMVKANYENSSTFYNQTETYDITDQCYGLMKDIIETLSTACNFRLWHCWLWSFQGRDTKSETFLAKDQLQSNEIIEF